MEDERMTVLYLKKIQNNSFMGISFVLNDSFSQKNHQKLAIISHRLQTTLNVL